jgi:hypothetical protein
MATLSQRNMENFARGWGNNGLGSSPSRPDPFQQGLKRLTEQHRRQMEQATAAQRAFMSGGAGGIGLSGKAARDSWGEGLAKIAAQNQAVRDAQAEAGAAGEASFGTQMIGKLATYAAALAGVKLMIDKIVQSHEHWIERGNQIKDITLSIANSQSNAVLNLTGLPSADKKNVLEKLIPDIQRRTGFPDQKVLIDTVGSGYATSNDLNQALKATESSARITKFVPEQTKPFARAAQAIMRATGETDADKALSFMLQVNSNVESPKLQAENLPPVLTAFSNNVKGDDNKEAARYGQAIYSILSREGADDTGDRSRTAATYLASYMREYFEKHKKYDPGTVSGRLKVLQENKKLRTDFLKGYKGELQFRAGVENILTPGTKAAGELWTEAERVNFERDAYDAAKDEQEKLTEQLKLADTEAGIQAKQQLATQDRPALIDAKRNQAWKAGETALSNTDRSWIDTTRRRTFVPLRGAFQDPDEKLEVMKSELEARAQQRHFEASGRFRDGTIPFPERQARAAADEKALQEAIEQIDTAKQEIKDLGKPPEKVNLQPRRSAGSGAANGNTALADTGPRGIDFVPVDPQMQEQNSLLQQAVNLLQTVVSNTANPGGAIVMKMIAPNPNGGGRD